MKNLDGNIPMTARKNTAKEEQELITKARDGDRQAFDCLMLAYQNRITKLLRRYIQDPNEIFDVVQETFIKAYSSLASFRGDSSFYTWLYRIAVNTAKNYLVAKGRRPPNFDLDITTAEATAEYRAQAKLAEQDSRSKMRFEMKSNKHYWLVLTTYQKN